MMVSIGLCWITHVEPFILSTGDSGLDLTFCWVMSYEQEEAVPIQVCARTTVTRFGEIKSTTLG